MAGPPLPAHPSSDEQWLTLGDAALRLGVHPTTLRAWADAGQIQVFRTPGGHRRFAASDIRRFLASGRSLVPAPAAEDLGGIVLRQTRADLARQTGRSQTWLASYDEDERRLRRESGRRLLGLTIQYLVRERGREQILAEGRTLGAWYGRESALRGQSLVDTTRAFLFFRESFKQAVHSPDLPTPTQDPDGARIQERLFEFMDEVLLGVLAAYEKTRLGAGQGG